MTEIIRANYPQLEEAAHSFELMSDDAFVLFHGLNTAQAAMVGEWEGFGAEAFFSEMDDTVLPAVKQLSVALFQISQSLSHIRTELEDAELRYVRDGLRDLLAAEWTGLGNVFGAIDNLRKMEALGALFDTFKKGGDLLDLIDNWDLLNILGSAGDDFVKEIDALFNLDDGLSWGKASTALGVLGAIFEGVLEYDGDSFGDLLKHTSAETLEFGLESLFRLAMYSNPVTGTAMAIYDVTNLWMAIDDDVYEILGLDWPDLEMPDLLDIDFITDAIGDGVVEGITRVGEAIFGWND